MNPNVTCHMCPGILEFKFDTLIKYNSQFRMSRMSTLCFIITVASKKQ